MDKITSIDKMLPTLSSSSFASGSRGGSSSSSGATTTTDSTVGSTSQSGQTVTSTQTGQTQTTAATTEEKKQALNEALSALQGNNTSLDFSIDQTSGVLVVKVLDKVTGDVVRQIPAEEVLVMRQQAEKQRGGLLDTVT